MGLQETGKIEFVFSPEAKGARIKDLINKATCWEGHIIIAQAREDSRQIRFGETRLKELRWQIGKDSRGLK